MFLKKVSTYSQLLSHRGMQRDFSKILKAFATVDPKNLGAQSKGYNLVNGEWSSTKTQK
jgi:hypothetical protein